MEFGPATYVLGYLAGALSTLSPCVLPLLPILVTTRDDLNTASGRWRLRSG
jgi:cytochrome c biogenesis protein CcdA